MTISLDKAPLLWLVMVETVHWTSSDFPVRSLHKQENGFFLFPTQTPLYSTVELFKDNHRFVACIRNFRFVH